MHDAEWYVTLQSFRGGSQIIVVQLKFARGFTNPRLLLGSCCKGYREDVSSSLQKPFLFRKHISLKTPLSHRHHKNFDHADHQSKNSSSKDAIKKKQNIIFLVELLSLMAFCRLTFPFATSSDASTACKYRSRIPCFDWCLLSDKSLCGCRKCEAR